MTKKQIKNYNTINWIKLTDGWNLSVINYKYRLKLVNFKYTVEHRHFCLNTKLNIMKIKCPLNSVTRVVSKALLAMN